MSIEPVGAFMPASFPTITPTSTAGATGAPGIGGPTGTGELFGAGLAGAVDKLQGMQSTSDALAIKAVTGDLDDVHDYTLASARSAVAFELTAALRNKAVTAFTEIMRMQA